MNTKSAAWRMAFVKKHNLVLLALIVLLVAVVPDVVIADDSSLTEVTTSTGVEMIWIDPGTFVMGSPEDEVAHTDKEQQHEVTLSRGFWLGKTEVTQRLWLSAMKSNPAKFQENDLFPVEMVSWLDCVSFCNELSKLEGLTPAYQISEEVVTWDVSANGYRLPTEAEWEYACRAGTTEAHAGDLDEMAIYARNSLRKTRVVGVRVPNAWGLHDMHGNLWEWCWDWFKREYGVEPVTDPIGPEEGSVRIHRGGSWHRNPPDCRSAARGGDRIRTKRTGLGFRLAKWANETQ